MTVKQIVNKNSVLRVWFISYLLVLILPLAVSVIIYLTAMGIIRKNTEEINTIALSQTGIAIDQFFSDIHAAGRGILNQEAVASLTYAERPLTSFKLEKIGNLRSSLDEYAAQGNYFRKIYVYFSLGGFAATTEGLYGTESFLRDLEKEAGAGSPVVSWIKEGRQFQVYMARSSTAASAPSSAASAPLSDSRTDKIIVIMSDVPSRMAPNVVCVFIIDYRPLYRLLDNYEKGTAGDARYLWLVSPGEGRSICPDDSFRFAGDLGPEFFADPGYIKALESRNLAVTAVDSGITGWTLVSAVPLRQYARELSQIRRVYLIYLFICLGAGGVVSVIFAQKNYRPVRNLSSILEFSSPGRREMPGDRSEFEYLADGIVLLLEKKRGYEREIGRQRGLIAEGKLVNILRGAVRSARAFKMVCGDYGFSFSTNCFFIIGIVVNEYSGVLYQKEDEASVDDLIDMLHTAVGFVFTETLRRSCDCYACRYDGNIFVVASRKDVPDGESGAAFIARLKDFCREGEAVIRERFSVRASVYISGLYSERQSGAMNIHDAFEEAAWGISHIKDFHGEETVMIKQDILSGMAEENNTAPLHAEIIRYIDENYANMNLSVTLIADHFSLSKSYLFRVFKKGENRGILDYIHQRRVEEAKILLRGSNSGINDIAVKIGYTNGLTLIRAFKRIEGITPTMYRSIARRF
ncbi:MAG: AraC family transcriptional regulator [Treponema sp.]|jgi:AraC-like DNA-binding protein|nr:AraC family transcriptional regulator [Treponema sp.]